MRKITTKKLKSVATPSAARDSEAAAPSPVPRLQPARLRKIAEQMVQALPQDRVSGQRTSTLINLRVDASLADWLADAAKEEGTTQKVIITRALAASGAPVSPLD